MAESLVFSQTFEALARAVGDAMSADGKAQFRALGVDFDKPLLPAYTYDTWVKSMDVGSHLLNPDGARTERHFRLGRRLADTYGETLIGKALVAAMRIIGPKRTLERMTRNLRSGNNFTETKLEQLPDGTFTLWVNHVTSPQFYCGLFSGVLEASGARHVHVEAASQDAQTSSATFIVKWA